MPNLVAVLLQRDAFSSDEDFVHFGESVMIPSVANLAARMGKDILWKPMNHSLLMATRDERTGVVFSS